MQSISAQGFRLTDRSPGGLVEGYRKGLTLQSCFSISAVSGSIHDIIQSIGVSPNGGSARFWGLGFGSMGRF